MVLEVDPVIIGSGPEKSELSTGGVPIRARFFDKAA